MNFIKFIKDVIANGKNVTVKSLSDTTEVLTDGENEFQIRLNIDESCKNIDIYMYQLFTGYDNINTGFLIYKLIDKNYFLIARMDDNYLPIFEDYRFTIEDNKVTFSNLPPDADDVKKIRRDNKVSNIILLIMLLLLPICAAGLLYLILIILSAMNCL